MNRSLRLAVLVFLLAALLASCSAPSSECETEADCPEGERCIGSGGVLVQGGRCVPTALLDTAADADTPDGRATDTDAWEGRDADTCSGDACVESCSYLGKPHGVCRDQRTTADGGCTRPDDYNEPTDEEQPPCDGKDNDCDGTVDEGCGCTYEKGEPDDTDTDGSHANGVCANQPTDDQGVCREPNRYLSRTSDESSSGACDGFDNDCDGVADEGCGCVYDPNEPQNVDSDDDYSNGICRNQSIQQSSGTCEKPDGFTDQSTGESQCDGRDDDCDGETDEEQIVCYTGVSDTSGTGRCSTGTKECSNSSACSDTIQISHPKTAELDCGNGTDDDCDGTVDDCYFRERIDERMIAIVRDVAVDSGSGVTYVTGTAVDFTSNDDRAFVGKYGPGGNRKWLKTITSEEIRLRGLALGASASKLYVAGRAVNDIANQKVSGRADGLLIRYNSIGDREKIQMIGTENRDTLDDIAFDPTDNHVVVGGYTDGGYKSSSNKGGTDPLLVELDRNFNVQWSDQFGSSSDDNIEALDIDDGNGNIYIAGDTQATVTPGATNSGNGGDIFSAKYLPAQAGGPTRDWIKQDGSTEDDDIEGVAVQDGRAVYIVGETQGDLRSNQHGGNDDAFLLKRDTSGTVKWFRSVATSAHDSFASVQFDSGSGSRGPRLFVVGGSSGTPGSSSNAGKRDALIDVYDASGNRRWLDLRGGPGLDAAQGIGSSTGPSRLVVGGVWDGSSTSGRVVGGDGVVERLR